MLQVQATDNVSVQTHRIDVGRVENYINAQTQKDIDSVKQTVTWRHTAESVSHAVSHRSPASSTALPRITLMSTHGYRCVQTDTHIQTTLRNTPINTNKDRHSIALCKMCKICIVIDVLYMITYWTGRLLQCEKCTASPAVCACHTTRIFHLNKRYPDL